MAAGRNRYAEQHPCERCQKPAWGRRCRPCVSAMSNPAPRRQDLDDTAEKKRRKRVVEAHVRVHGSICPGWRRPPHPSRKLCADHPIEVILGGVPIGGDYDVLCPSCNSAKSNVNRAAARKAVASGSREW